jgi:hypothetical protein
LGRLQILLSKIQPGLYSALQIGSAATMFSDIRWRRPGDHGAAWRFGV